MSTMYCCCRASTNSIAVSSSSVVAPAVTGSSVVTAVSSTTLHTAHSMSSITEHVPPLLLLDDNSTSSSCLPSTPVTDKPVHYPKKVGLPDCHSEMRIRTPKPWLFFYSDLGYPLDFSFSVYADLWSLLYSSLKLFSKAKSFV